MEKLDAVLKSLEGEMVETLQRWVRVPSLKAEAEPGAPFGPVLKGMLEKALGDCERLGFRTENFDGFIGHADMGDGSDEDALGILAHVDIVPVGDGWKEEPFGANIRDGKLYGRGSSDDKGPAVAALYAMKAVREAGIPLKRKVRLILGCDEESGWLDIDHYNKVAAMPRMGFSPDASYPVINLEKGMCGLELKADLSDEGLQVIAFNVGERPNVVPGQARATVRGGVELVQKVSEVEQKYGWPVSAVHKDGVVSITATGINGHAAMPEMGRNAIGQMLITLRELGAQGAIRVLADALGTQYYGEGLGIQVNDKMSGPLTCNMGIIRAGEGKLTGRLDIRYPLLCNPQMLDKLISLHLPGFEINEVRFKAPHFVPEQSELVQSLLAAYHEVTGNEKFTIAIGGGTYSRSLKEGVAFGAQFPGEPDVAHQADEYIDVENLKRSMRIFARAIVKLAGV